MSSSVHANVLSYYVGNLAFVQRPYVPGLDILVTSCTTTRSLQDDRSIKYQHSVLFFILMDAMPNNVYVPVIINVYIIRYQYSQTSFPTFYTQEKMCEENVLHNLVELLIQASIGFSDFFLRFWIHIFHQELMEGVREKIKGFHS